MSVRYVLRDAHNPLCAPSACLCRECARVVLDMRCPARGSANDGHPQCGNFKGHRGLHTMLIATTFEIAAARLASV